MIRVSRLYQSVLLLFILCLSSWGNALAVGTPSITAPVPESALESNTQLFSWTNNDADVTAWWLYAGSTSGAHNYFNSGNLATSTSVTVTGLPDNNSDVYIRLWYQLGSAAWSHIDAHYTAAATGSNPVITSPAAESTLNASTQTMSWDDNGAGVTEWWLYAGSTPGAANYFNSASLGTDTSVTVSGLPGNGADVHVRLWYRTGSASWFHVDSHYTTGEWATPAMSSPAESSNLSSPQLFSWDDNGSSVSQWWLYLGSAPGAHDYYDSGSLGTTTSTSASGWPMDGSAVHARLWYRFAAGRWQYTDSEFTTGTTNSGQCTAAECDAARLLTQATFGSTLPGIAQVINAGGPADWIDEQIALPASYHLPTVRGSSSDGRGTRYVRRSTFWDRGLHADDQLRQRMAFALSEIMVVSDVPESLQPHGNMLAAYYDILVEHGLGNYRDLLAAVTLNPTMGNYLSMLANEKPDPATGRRADENYAREVMQLFSIGLVELNANGTTRLDSNNNPIPTYNQSDVENVARALTGWSWNATQWHNAGRWPAVSEMESPMISFASHHDVDAKQFLGVSLAAGRSAQQDLDSVINTLFNHANVGPFIGKQLIKKLVTSNPSPAYVARVAAVFNDNGQGIRGDLAAVSKAILMDDEARSATTSDGSTYGKLREPLLRLSHILRAFNVVEPVTLNGGYYISQFSALTANSVFNFFGPDYSPAGPIKDAGLVAPEFQINSESRINRVNSSLVGIAQLDTLFGLFDATLNLDDETALLATPESLMDHLDLKLLSGNMSTPLRQLLLDYVDSNQPAVASGIVSNERILRDVISLVITSAEFTVQR